MSGAKRPWPKGWGPTYPAKKTDPRLRWGTLGALALTLNANGVSWPLAIVIVAVGYAVVVFVLPALERASEGSRTADRLARSSDPLAAVLEESARLGGGTYLGTTYRGPWRLAGPERGVLLLGPPRSGKSSAVIVPSVIAHRGPVVSTSTKPDVLRATVTARCRIGIVWGFDPTGSHQGFHGFELRWSPVAASRSWDGALLTARAMVFGAGVGAGTTESTHWTKRASALLAPLLHAAALGEQDIGTVVDWVLRHELDQPGINLSNAGADLAAGVLVGLQNTEARERSSIFSAAADALDAYTSHAALKAAANPNFDADKFVRSADTIYIHAPAEQQQLAAPLVCGLISEIRSATYRAHHQGALPARVLFALDEVANIAPLAELPAIAAEGGGQGLQLLAALQDLSQARARWGSEADGFLTLFGSKLLLPGIADTKTLEAVSVALGEYDRQVTSTSSTPNPNTFFSNRTTRTWSTQRQRVLPPGDVANIPAGHALHLAGVRWELLTLTPAHRSDPWRTLTQLTAATDKAAAERVREPSAR
jgi:type IV secretory pathway TraG/TraD family ATPase VirD4